MSIRDRNLIVLLSMGAAVLLGSLWWISGPGPANSPPPPGPAAPVPESIQKLAKNARELQKDGKWCDAKGTWQQTLDQLGDTHPDLRQEAAANLAIAQEKCKPTHQPIDELNPEPPKNLPARVPEDQIVRFYKTGKTVHSLAYLDITGEGTNQNFILKGTTHFAYRYQLIAETKVVENRGTAVVFELHFLDVAQLRAESHQELELELPDSPILAIIWNELEKNVLNPIPVYVVVKRAAELINVADPGLKSTLTRFNETLRHLGRPLVPAGDEVLPLVQKVSELAGQKVRLTYVSGLGIAEIKVLEGKKLPPRDLERLAYCSSLLMDYFLGEKLPAEPGTTLTIRMADLGGMFGLFDLETNGELKFKAKTNRNYGDEPVDVLEIVGGEVVLNSRSPGAGGHGNIKPLPGGFVYYSPEKLLVRRAQFAWHGDAEWFSHDSLADNLLGGTTNLSNVQVETYYEADLVEAGK